MLDFHFGKTEISLSKGLDKRTEYGIANGARRANQARRRKQEYERKRSRARREHVNSACSMDVRFGAHFGLKSDIA